MLDFLKLWFSRQMNPAWPPEHNPYDHRCDQHVPGNYTRERARCGVCRRGAR